MPSDLLSSVVVLVLAAGKGRRFAASGAQVHKLDALLHGQSVLERTCQCVAEAGLFCHVVRPEGAATAGMGDSIAHGVRATAHALGWLILPGDMPMVRASTLRAVAQALQNGHDRLCVVPHWKQQPGHPVAFAAQCAPALLALRGDVGARSVRQMLSEAAHCSGQELVQALHVDDPGVLYDIDTLHDLEVAAHYFQCMNPSLANTRVNTH